MTKGKNKRVKARRKSVILQNKLLSLPNKELIVTDIE